MGIRMSKQEYDLINLPPPVVKIRDKWISERKYDDGEQLSEQDKIILQMGFDAGFSIGFQHLAFTEAMKQPLKVAKDEPQST